IWWLNLSLVSQNALRIATRDERVSAVLEPSAKISWYLNLPASWVRVTDLCCAHAPITSEYRGARSVSAIVPAVGKKMKLPRELPILWIAAYKPSLMHCIAWRPPTTCTAVDGSHVKSEDSTPVMASPRYFPHGADGIVPRRLGLRYSGTIS